MNEKFLKLTTWIGIGLGLLGVIISQEQIPLPLPRRDWLALILVGLGVILGFFHTLISGQIVFSEEGFSGQDTYTGFAGHLWGVLMISIGSILTILGFRAWLTPNTAWDWIHDPVGWGWIAAGMGMLIMILSLINLIGSQENQQSSLYWLVRAAWLGILLLGMVVASAGVLQSLMPGLIESWLRPYFPPLPPPPLFPGE